MWSGWPSGLRRCVQVAVYSCRRGFESHFWHVIFFPSFFVGIPLLALSLVIWVDYKSVFWWENTFAASEWAVHQKRWGDYQGVDKKSKTRITRHLCTGHLNLPPPSLGDTRGKPGVFTSFSLSARGIRGGWVMVWREFATSFERLGSSWMFAENGGWTTDEEGIISVA